MYNIFIVNITIHSIFIYFIAISLKYKMFRNILPFSKMPMYVSTAER